MEREKILANRTSDKEPISKTYKNSYNSEKNWAKDLIRHFSKEDILMVEPYIKNVHCY